MSDHGPEEPFEPEREDEQHEEKGGPEEDEERKPETLRNPWAKTSSGDA